MVKAPDAQPTRDEAGTVATAPAPLDPDTVIESALAKALTEASAAGQWKLVAELAAQLEARGAAREREIGERRARGRGNVVRLPVEARRARGR